VTRYVNYPNDRDGGHFGTDWNKTPDACVGLIKKHTGTDYRASVGDAVYAPEDGLVKEESSAGDVWAWRIVIEHDHPTRGKYTTLLMHIDSLVRAGTRVYKGITPVGTVAYLATGKHLHFGIRMGAYHAKFSGRGALPQVACAGDPAFQEKFIDSEDTSKVLFK
jgi:murein DD-endopeptidase MepM/ murein hydrolase activator NlpD